MLLPAFVLLPWELIRFHPEITSFCKQWWLLQGLKAEHGLNASLMSPQKLFSMFFPWVCGVSGKPAPPCAAGSSWDTSML